MASYRQIHSKIWTDPWFIDLETDAKLLFIYLFSNDRVNVLGIYDISVKTVAHETDMDRSRVEEILRIFEDRGKIKRDGNWLWVVNLFVYNATNLRSPKIHTHIETLLHGICSTTLKQQWLQKYRITLQEYGIDTVSYGIGTETETETETDTDTPQPPAKKAKKKADPPPPSVQIFHANTQRYPVKSLYPDIEEAIGNKPADLEFWADVVKNWLLMGWSKTNVKGMIEFYKRREIPPGNGKNGKSPPPREDTTKYQPVPIPEEGSIFGNGEG